MPHTVSQLDAVLLEAAQTFGTPSFVYFTDAIAARALELRRAFGGRFALSYAVKSNPNPGLLEWLAPHVEMLDISSIGEMRLARRAGWAARRLSFTGPGKRDFELHEAIAGGIGELVLESLREALAADRIAAAAGRAQDVMLRIGPSRVPEGFGERMAGQPSAFGIDEEEAASTLPRILALEHLRVVGLHIYSGTQCLEPEAICANYRIFLGLFRQLAQAHDLHPRKLVLGSGLGIPYHDGDTALDLDEVARGIVDELDALGREPRFGRAQLVLELGRHLVGEAGYFLTRVVSVKSSRGALIAVCDGGMNNQLSASGHLSTAIQRNYRMHKIGADAPLRRTELVGPLCTSIDRLARGVDLPAVAEGDLIAVHASGAYGLTASPLHFISHVLPREVLVEGAAMRDVTRRLGDLES